MNGILLVDKPKGWSSFDVVAKVRGTLRRAQLAESARLSHVDAAQGSQEERARRVNDTVSERQTPADTALRHKLAGMAGVAGQQGDAVRKLRVGHAGTLDPLASGLMILLIGSATKQADRLLKLDKSYDFTAQLGATTVTGDAEGEPEPWPNAKAPTESQITEVIKQFTGEIMQRPHSYSAIKVNGQPAYKQARKGQPIELKSRTVVIHSLEVVSYEYPKLKCRTKVSSGTYIRSLAEDIGKGLNTGAYLTDLRRTTIASYRVDEAVSPEADAEKIISSVIPLE